MRGTCPACGGLGWRPWGARVLAEQFGVGRHVWETRWAKRYARVAQMREAVEGRGLAAVERAMRCWRKGGLGKGGLPWRSGPWAPGGQRAARTRADPPT